MKLSTVNLFLSRHCLQDPGANHQRKNNAFPRGQEVDSTIQHEFVSSRSCLTNLLETLEKWSEYLDSGHGLNVVYLHYRKAFDAVPHDRLLTVVLQVGISGKESNWMKAFL